MAQSERITVTLPKDVLDAVRGEAGGNVSAYTAKALQTQAVRDSAARLAAWQASRLDEIEDLQAMSFRQLDAEDGNQ